MVNIAHASFLLIQKSFFVAGVMNTVLYGTYLTLGAAAIYHLRQLTGLPRRTLRIMASLIVVVACLYTVFVISMSTMFYRMIFITLRQSDLTTACLSTAFSCLTAVSAIGDALFTYRCWIIWGRTRLIWIPVFFLVTEVSALLATDILIAFDGTLQAIQPHTSASELLSISASSLTVFFNVMLAFAAIVKLLLARRQLRRAALPGGGAHYIQIAHVLAGSTVMYAAGWIPMIVLRRDIISIPYLSFLFFVVASLPLVIILHVAWRSHKDQPFILPEIVSEREEETNASGDMFPTFKPFRRESDGTDWYSSRDAQEDAAVGVWRRESDATLRL